MKIDDPNLDKFSIKLESELGKDEIIDFFKSQGVKFSERNEERVLKRLRFLARRKSFNNYLELLTFLKSDSDSLESALDWLEKGRVYNEAIKNYAPLINRKKSISDYVKMNEKSKKIRQKKKQRKRILKPIPAIFSALDEPPDPQNIKLVEDFLLQKKINYQAYKEKYFLRRLLARMRKIGANTFKKYALILKEDPLELDLLVKNLSINVTRFFRDRDTYKALQTLVLPKIFNTNGKSIKIWSAGCAVGAEPYSIAMIILSHFKDVNINQFSILGTDISLEFIKLAKKGLYHKDLLKELDPGYIHSYFTPVRREEFRLSTEIKNRVKFQIHDLRNPPPNHKNDLILCRNVLIYFSREESEKLFQRFYSALKPKGFLVLGKCEMMPPSARLNFAIVDTRTRIYQKLG